MTLWILLLKYQRVRGRLVTMLYRDGIAYFLALTSTLPSTAGMKCVDL